MRIFLVLLIIVFAFAYAAPSAYGAECITLNGERYCKQAQTQSDESSDDSPRTHYRLVCPGRWIWNGVEHVCRRVEIRPPVYYYPAAPAYSYPQTYYSYPDYGISPGASFGLGLGLGLILRGGGGHRH